MDTFSSSSTQNDGNSYENHLSAVVVHMLQNKTRQTCYEKCFGNSGGKGFVDVLGKNEKICLAKCMDRMFEAYSIVTKASAEMAQNLQSQEDIERR